MIFYFLEKYSLPTKSINLMEFLTFKQSWFPKLNSRFILLLFSLFLNLCLCVKLAFNFLISFCCYCLELTLYSVHPMSYCLCSHYYNYFLHYLKERVCIRLELPILFLQNFVEFTCKTVCSKWLWGYFKSLNGLV